jgi:hypothetical protein
METIFWLVEHSPGSSSRVWRMLHDAGLYPYHVQHVQHLEPEDPVQLREFCHWLNANNWLYQLMLFTNEAAFTHDSINNSFNTHRRSQENPNAIV